MSPNATTKNSGHKTSTSTSQENRRLAIEDTGFGFEGADDSDRVAGATTFVATGPAALAAEAVSVVDGGGADWALSAVTLFTAVVDKILSLTISLTFSMSGLFATAPVLVRFITLIRTDSSKTSDLLHLSKYSAVTNC